MITELEAPVPTISFLPGGDLGNAPRPILELRDDEASGFDHYTVFAFFRGWQRAESGMSSSGLDAYTRAGWKAWHASS